MTYLDDKNFKTFISSNDKVVVDFFASWCGPCRALAPVFEAVEGKVNGWKFVKVDVDKAQNLALSLGVNTIPTIIIFEKGQEVERNVGYLTEQQLIDLIG